MPARLQTAAVIMLLFAAAWIPRFMALDSFATPDERRWLTRSANYLYALEQQQWADTFQREHPGVTVMWAGVAGLLTRLPTYAQEAPGQFGWAQEELEAWLAANADPTPLELLTAGRWWVTLAVALLLALSFLPLRRLIDPRLAVVGLLLVVWDPFLLAHTRLLHPDGLLAALSWFSLLCFLVWLFNGNSRRYLALAAVSMGLAWLTKTPAAFLTLTGLLLVAWRLMQAAVDRRRLLIDTTGWLLVAGSTAALLWPALWVAPLETLQRMQTEMAIYVGGHINVNFFLGQITERPGPLFYPVAILLRLTPLTLIGLPAAAWAGWRRRWPLRAPLPRQVALSLLLFVVVFTAGMTLVAKEFDRYALPIFPALDLIAALGLAAVARVGLARFGGHTASPDAWPQRSAAVLCALVLLQGATVLRHAPYYLTYYNPLLGGAPAAQRTLLLGWGEGLDAAARWINEQPDGERAKVVAWYHDGPVSYFLDSRHPVLDFWRPEFWFDADYAIVYANQRQRQYPTAQTLAVFDAMTPVHSVQRHGVVWAEVYDLRNEAPPAFSGYRVDAPAVFDDAIELGAYRLDQAAYRPGETVRAELALKRVGPVEREYVSSLRMVTEDGQEIQRSDKLPGDRTALDWQPYSVRPDVHALPVPQDLPPGAYYLELSLYDLNAPDRSAQVESSTSNVDRTTHRVTALDVVSVTTRPMQVAWNGVELVQLRLLEEASPGENVLVEMTVEGAWVPGLKISTRLVSSADRVIAQVDKPLEATISAVLSVPEETPAGAYQLVAVLYNEADLQPIADAEGRHETPLAEIWVEDE